MIAQFIWQSKWPLFCATWLLLCNSCWHSVAAELLGSKWWTCKCIKWSSTTAKNQSALCCEEHSLRNTSCVTGEEEEEAERNNSPANGNTEGQDVPQVAESTWGYRSSLIPEFGVLNLLNWVKDSPLSFYIMTSPLFGPKFWLVTQSVEGYQSNSFKNDSIFWVLENMLPWHMN